MHSKFVLTYTGTLKGLLMSTSQCTYNYFVYTVYVCMFFWRVHVFIHIHVFMTQLTMLCCVVLCLQEGMVLGAILLSQHCHGCLLKTEQVNSFLLKKGLSIIPYYTLAVFLVFITHVHLIFFVRPSKRRKLDEPHHQPSPVLTIQTGSRQHDQHITESFLVAIDCWDFLQSNITYRGGMYVCMHVCMYTSLNQVT